MYELIQVVLVQHSVENGSKSVTSCSCMYVVCKRRGLFNKRDVRQGQQYIVNRRLSISRPSFTGDSFSL